MIGRRITPINTAKTQSSATTSKEFEYLSLTPSFSPDGYDSFPVLLDCSSL